MTDQPVIPEWVALLVGKQALENEALRRENEALRDHLKSQRPPEPSEPSG